MTTTTYKRDEDEVGYHHDKDIEAFLLLSSMPVDGKWAHATLIRFETHPDHPDFVTIYTMAGMNGSRGWLSSHMKQTTTATARRIYRACLDRGWHTDKAAYVAMEAPRGN